VKIFKNILLIFLIIGILALGLGISTSVKQHFSVQQEIPKNSVRMHCYAFGKTEQEATINDEKGIEKNIPNYTLIKVKTISFDSDGTKIWICDATIDVNKSFLENSASELGQKI
jgi:hypothetical protein